MKSQQAPSGNEDRLVPRLITSQWHQSFEPGLLAIMQAQRARDPDWPPEYAHGSDLNDWLASPADVRRIVAHTSDQRVVGHVGAGSIKSKALGERWEQRLNCPVDQMAEICRLVIDPTVRRQGISGLLTKRLVRELVEAGRVPVATALRSRTASIKMMTSIGWRVVGTEISERTGLDLCLLVSPGKLVTRALEVRTTLHREDTADE